MSSSVIARLVAERKRRGLSQSQVAELMGTSQSAVARLEKGGHNARMSTVHRYAAEVGMTLGFTERLDEAGQPVREQAPASRQSSSWHLAQDENAPAEPDPNHVLTWRQLKILQMLSDYVHERGYVPSMREIGQAVGLVSSSSVAYQLKVLRAKGYIRKLPNQPRAVEVRLPGSPSSSAADRRAILSTAFAPMVSRLTTGPITDQAVDDVFPLPRQVTGEGDLLLIRFTGDSMVSARILDGDLVVVRRDADAHDGCLVAARVNGELTVRLLRSVGDQLWLMSYDSASPPKQADRADILGPVVSVMRQVPLPVAVVSAQNHALRGDGFEPSLRGAASFVGGLICTLAKE